MLSILLKNHLPQITNDAINLYSLADSFYKQRDKKKSKKYYDLLIDCKQENLDGFYYYHMGKAYMLKHSFNIAIGNFNQALEFDPDNVFIIYQIASCYYLMNKKKESFKYLKQLSDILKPLGYNYKLVETFIKEEMYINIIDTDRFKQLFKKKRESRSSAMGKVLDLAGFLIPV